MANYRPIISRNTIVKNSTSMGSIWSAIRLYLGFEVIGAHFLDFSDIHLEHSERPENLYQRLMAFPENNLLLSSSIQHHGALLTEDEEWTPSLENLLYSLGYGLCILTSQNWRALASIKPEISQALQSLLDEIRTTEDASVMRTAASSYRRPAQAAKPTTRFRTRPKSSPLCKKAGHGDSLLSECTYLPDTDESSSQKLGKS